jgi:hypothetical protein
MYRALVVARRLVEMRRMVVSSPVLAMFHVKK